MLDVYVVVLLAATIRFGPLASVQAGPGLLAFAAVVVLTMLATYAFDPQLIWDDPAPLRAEARRDCHGGPHAGRPPDPAQPPAAPGAAAPSRRGRRRRAPRSCRNRAIVEARRWNVSLVWLLPAVAVAIGASLLVRSVFLIGPRIDIEFASADGVEAGKTDVRYKEVVIGKVVSRCRCATTARASSSASRLDRSAASFAVEDTAFWVVRPRIGVGGVSGLGTLLSGAYIGTDAGVSTKSRRPSSRASRRRPSCCAASPARSSCCAPTTSARSTSARRCSIAAPASAGSSATRSTPSATSCRCGSSSRRRTSKLVGHDTRFWNASGIDLTRQRERPDPQHPDAGVGARRRPGVREPPDAAARQPAPENTVFTLFNDRTRGDGAAGRPAGAGADGVRLSRCAA